VFGPRSAWNQTAITSAIYEHSSMNASSSINAHEKLAGKFALVSDGPRGIGAAIAQRLAADGASVAITYSGSAAKAAEVVQAIESAGGRALALRRISATCA
jgi:3-oxoacyl-[acyl-carrier protein] reductase